MFHASIAEVVGLIEDDGHELLTKESAVGIGPGPLAGVYPWINF